MIKEWVTAAAHTFIISHKIVYLTETVEKGVHIYK